VVLAYDYGERIALLEDPPDGSISPHLYPLCGPCADRLIPPRGWRVEDRRYAPPLFLPEPSPAPTTSEAIASEESGTEVTRRLVFGESA
jgi:hypothetical protein